MRAGGLQHVPFEGPDAFAPVLMGRCVSLDHYLVPQDGLPPDPGDLLIVMGEPRPDASSPRLRGREPFA